MKLRCKPGDLAVVVRSEVGNEGKVVRVLRFLGRAKFSLGFVADDVWLVECPSLAGETCSWSRRIGGDACFPDARLRPIRDPGDDAQDETLQWLDVPQKEVA